MEEYWVWKSGREIGWDSMGKGVIEKIYTPEGHCFLKQIYHIHIYSFSVDWDRLYIQVALACGKEIILSLAGEGVEERHVF